MINYIIINGTNSNTINGLGINELPPISKPPLRVQTEEIDGRDGDISTNLGYGAYDKTISIGLFGTGYDINDVISFFNGEGTVVFSNEPNKYYKYKIINQIDYEALLKFKSATITFHCQPFKYPLTETPLEIEYEYIEQDGVESATMNNTNGGTSLKLDLKGNTSQTGTPTPSTPIPINVVSGDNTIKVEGKNLISSVIKSGNMLFFNGLNDNSYGFKAGTYTISFNATTNPAVYVKTASTSSTKVGNGSPQTFTMNEDFVVWIYRSGLTDNEVTDIQLEKNSQATTYEPYQSQTYPIYLGVENLLNPIGQSQTYGDMAITNNGDGTFTINGTSNANWGFSLTDLNTTPIVLQANETYTQSLEILSGDLGDALIVPAFKNDGGSISYNYFRSSKNSLTSTKTTTEKMTCYSYNVYWTSGTTITNCTFRVQLEKGTKANHYTAYGTTPIELCKIGDYQDYFTKNSGKNLFNYGTAIRNKTFTGQDVVSDSTGLFISDYIKVEPNTTYYVNENAPVVLGLDENKNSLGYIRNTSSAGSFTTQATCEYIRIRAYNTTIPMETAISKTMLNTGSTALPYEPYGTGQWCKYNAIGKVVLNGSENWQQSGNQPTSRLKVYLSKTINCISTMSTNYDLLLCNLLIGISSSNYSGSLKQGLNLVPEGFNVCLETGSTLQGWKNLLNSTNMITYYPLATPYLSLIEDETLISQLDNIQNAMSYDGTTNIGQVNNDKPFLLDLIAMKDGSDEVVINNIGNVYAKPTIALEGTGETDIYLNNTEILKVDLSEKNKITIDTNNMEAYDPNDNSLANRKVIGNYNSMTLPSGNTTMKITGALDKATITSYVRWL